eukprot:861052-Ditylum_brightwellii.AAC.1
MSMMKAVRLEAEAAKKKGKACTLYSMTTAGMGSGKMATNVSMSDENSKSVIDAPKVPVTPTNATATATTAGVLPQIYFYDSNSTDSLIVFNYRAKLQEQVNNINDGTSYCLCLLRSRSNHCHWR